MGHFLTIGAKTHPSFCDSGHNIGRSVTLNCANRNSKLGTHLSMNRRKRRILDQKRGPTTFVAANTEITGTIKGEGEYIFCGTVEGDCSIDGPVTLAAGGVWRGTMRGEDLIIAGEVEGDVVAAQRVEVSGTAKVTGSLSGNSIAVAEGAVIEGEIKVTSGDSPVNFEEKRTELQPKQESADA